MSSGPSLSPSLITKWSPAAAAACHGSVCSAATLAGARLNLRASPKLSNDRTSATLYLRFAPLGSSVPALTGRRRGASVRPPAHAVLRHQPLPVAGRQQHPGLGKRRRGGPARCGL